MSGKHRISAVMAAPLCALALLAPAHAQDSLFDRPATAIEAPAVPTAQGSAPQVPAAAPKVKPKPKPKHIVKPKRKPSSEPVGAQAPVPAAPVAQEPEPEPGSAFGQQMPRQSLINRFTSPEKASSPAAPGAPQGAGAPSEPAEDTQPNGMPSKYLLNRLFNSSALEPAKTQPDPRSFIAQAAPAQPAAQPSWFDQAAGALGFGKKDSASELPPVNVTAPAARPAAAPAPSAAVPPPAPSASLPPPQAPATPSHGWFDNAKDAIGLGNDTAPVPDYSERPKLAVPANRDALPRPNPMDERKVPRPASAEALTKPPSGYLDKVQGADGKVSGFTKEDEGKNKKFLNFF